MAIDNETQEEISQLQIIQQQLQMIMSQEQIFQQKIIELKSSLEELKKTDKPVYKLVGEALIQKNSKELIKDLEKEEEQLNVRLKSFESQEKRMQSKAKELQEKVTKKLQKKKD